MVEGREQKEMPGKIKQMKKRHSYVILFDMFILRLGYPFFDPLSLHQRYFS
jgi:hypothetical protein